MPIKNFTTTGTTFSIVYDGLAQGTWDRLDELDSKYDVDVRDSSATLSLRNPGFSDTLKASDTLQVNGAELTGTFREKMEALKNVVLYKAGPGSALPTEYPATYAAMQASITADPTTKRDFFVTADETNGGKYTKYNYNGISAIRQVDVQQVGRFQPGKGLKAAAIGTSIYANGLRSTDGIVVAIGNTWAAMGSAGVQIQGSGSWFSQACLRSAGRLRLQYNAGISGDVLSNMVTRFQTDVINKKPQIVFLGDATNDINGAVSNTLIRGYIDTMVKAALSNDITPILVTTTPRNDDTAKNQRVREHNLWMQRYAAANNLWFIDTWGVLVDSSTGNFLASYTSDGIHPNDAGAIVAADKVLADLAGLLPGNTNPSKASFVAQSRVQNPNLLFNSLYQDDSNADGLADSWTKSGLVTCTTVTDAAVLGKAQQLAFTGAGSFNQQLSIDSVKFSVGDRLAWSGLAKASAGGSLIWALTLSFPGATYTVSPIYTNSQDQAWFAYYCEAVIPPSAVSLRAGLEITSGSGTIWFAQQQLVNLTKQGIDTIV